jgi:hypothetical protein
MQMLRDDAGNSGSTGGRAKKTRTRSWYRAAWRGSYPKYLTLPISRWGLFLPRPLGHSTLWAKGLRLCRALETAPSLIEKSDWSGFIL